MVKFVVGLAVVLTAIVLVPGETEAQQGAPATIVVEVPTAPGEQTYTWSGTVPAGSTNPESNCDGGNGVQRQAFQVNRPADLYDRLQVTYDWTIRWTPTQTATTNDEILTVIDPTKPPATDEDEDEGDNRTVGSSDGGAPSETVSARNLKGTSFEALTCGYINGSNQPFTGTLRVTAVERTPDVPLPAAPANGLDFTPSIAADPQRRSSEPLIDIDDQGATYVCGPSGVTSTEYAQVSLDGGDQFNPLGEGPQYRPTGVPGGGDCGLAISPFPDPQTKKLPLAITGLGPLTNFVTAASNDNGQTLDSGNSNSIPGVDRQWMTFVDPDTVLLAYNQQQPRQIVVQRSTDRGRTYQTNSVPASPVSPLFPGPMRSLPAEFNPAGADKGRVAYFAFDDFNQNVYLSLSTDKGQSFKHCLVARQPGESTLFTTADHDDAGNIYVGYGEDTDFHTYVTVLTRDKLAECNTPINTTRGTQSAFSTKNPGWSPPVQVDREGIKTTVFPWIVAGGAPGRVAVAFYGTETDGNPDLGSFKATWHVYVNQSLNMLRPTAGGGHEFDPAATFSQVKATTHPFHYDSICLGGLGCTASGGDRSLADFFAIDYNPASKKLQLTYNQTYKRPDDAGGQITLPIVVTQRSGPSNGGGDVVVDERPVVRQASADPKGDALADFSTLTPTPRATRNEPAMDFESATTTMDAAGDLEITMDVADLSDAALNAALNGPSADRRSQSLLWVFRWANGYRTGAASARWSPSGGFTYGFNGYQRAGAPECLNSSCQVYRGDTPIKGAVDRTTGTFVLTVPRTVLRALEGPEGPGQRPAEVPAVEGSRFYDGTAFSFGNTQSATQSMQGFMLRFDNTPAMDFRLTPAAAPPVSTPTPSPTGTASPSATATSTAEATATAESAASETPTPTPTLGPPTPDPTPAASAPCARSGLRSVSARPEGSGLRLGFRQRGNRPVDVAIYRASEGRRVLRGRLVARFADRTSGFKWDGDSDRRGDPLRDGHYVVRFASGRGARRLALVRRNGTFSRRPAFDRRRGCKPIAVARLERSVFGGPTERPLTVSVRLTEAAPVTVTIMRKNETVREIVLGEQDAGRTFRLRFSPAGRPRGDYRAIVRVGEDSAALVARRL